MAAPVSEPRIITPEDINPRHNWSRALRSPGTMAVDFEERVDFRRLHRYRRRLWRDYALSGGAIARRQPLLTPASAIVP